MTDAINKINSRKKDTLDLKFWLFNSLPNISNNKLNFVLQELVATFALTGDSGNYVDVIKFEARWVDDKKNFKNVSIS